MLRFYFIIIFFGLFALLGCANQTREKEEIIEPQHVFKDLRLEIIDNIKNKNINSFAVAVVHGDTILWKECFNKSPINDSIEISGNAIYPIASLSKSMSSVLMHNLHENKIIDLNKNLNEIQELKGLYISKNTQVRDLLSMTAGIPHGWMFVSKEIANLKSDLIDSLSTSYHFSAFKNKTHEYSNLSFGITEFIIESTAKKKYEQLLKDKLFSQLGMTQSYVGNSFINSGHGDYLNATKKFDFYPKAAAGIYSSLEDLLKFASFLKNGNSKILSQKTLQNLKLSKPNEESIVAQGIGNVRLSDEITWLVSNGSFSFPIECNSNLSIIPEKDLTIICLADKNYNSFSDIMAIKIADKKIPGFMDKAFAKMENHEKFNVEILTQLEATSKKWKATINDLEIELKYKSNQLLIKSDKEKDLKPVDYLNIDREGILRFGTQFNVKNPFSNKYEYRNCTFNLQINNQNLEGYYSVDFNKENKYFLSLPTKINFNKNSTIIP